MTTGYHICRPSDPKTVSCEILNSMDPFLDKKKVYGNIGPFEGKKKKKDPLWREICRRVAQSLRETLKAANRIRPKNAYSV